MVIFEPFGIENMDEAVLWYSNNNEIRYLSSAIITQCYLALYSNTKSTGKYL